MFDGGEISGEYGTERQFQVHAGPAGGTGKGPLYARAYFGHMV